MMLIFKHMHLVLRFLRWSLHKLSIAILANAITIGAPLLAVSIHFTNPSIIKGWLSTSNMYENVVSQSLGLIAISSEENEVQATSLEDQFAQNPFIETVDITNALAESITPRFLEEQTSSVIDGMYAWLDGSENEPIFTFSIATKQDEIGVRLGDTLNQKLASLPECLPEELTPDFDLIEARCLPPGVSITGEIDRFVDEFTGENGLLSGAEWNQEDIIKREGEESGLSRDQLKYGQQAFSGLKQGPILLFLAGALCAIVVYYTSRTRYRGFSEIGNTIFSGSLFVFGTSLILSRFESIATKLIGENDSTNTTVKAARAIFEPLVQTIVHDVASLTAVISGSTLVLGTFMVGFSFFLKRRYQKEENDIAEREWRTAAEKARIREIKQRAKKHPKKYAHLTKDKKTQKPLKGSKEKITVHHARKIARDPDSNKRSLDEITEESRK